uniref:Uncharacterized protein n=1 Tax=Megaselia scalaris TaxID=36166 RepID=T1GAT6_MEGSC
MVVGTYRIRVPDAAEVGGFTYRIPHCGCKPANLGEISGFRFQIVTRRSVDCLLLAATFRKPPNLSSETDPQLTTHKDYSIIRDTLYESVAAMLQASIEKKRNFLETLELKIGLKNYDHQRTIVSQEPSTFLEIYNILMKLSRTTTYAEALNKWNKNKKLVKNLANILMLS